MGKIIDLVKWSVTLGKEPQNFLGAKWIPVFLKKIPKSRKRKWALRVLNLSPHYFFDRDNPKFKGLGLDEYLETVFQINARSREEIYQKMLKPYFRENFTILEYGCGPGFLAKAVSPFVKKVFACDISGGALACAEIVNYADNIKYIPADNIGLSMIKNEGLDAVYSFAVIQHLTDVDFEILLENCRQKLKKGGKLLLHIQLEDEVWKTEENWKNDESIKGKLKYKYGLHCFGRTKENHLELISKHGFIKTEFESLKYLENNNSSVADSQFLLIAQKP